MLHTCSIFNFFLMEIHSCLLIQLNSLWIERDFIGYRTEKENFFQAFYVNGNIIMLAMLSLKNKLKKYNLRRRELLLHPLTLHSVDFLALPVLRQHVVLQSWRLLTSMQTLSNLHSGHTAAFHNPASAFPWLPNSSAAWHCTGTSRARERAWESQETSGAAKSPC